MANEYAKLSMMVITVKILRNLKRSEGLVVWKKMRRLKPQKGQ